MIGTMTSTPWSAQQLSWLQAMGYTVYLDRKTFPKPASTDKTPCTMPENGSMHERQDTTHPLETLTMAHSRTDAIPVPQRRGHIGIPDRLQIALLRACTGNPSDPQVQQIMATWPLAQLRADPDAKRALWPQLRAIRRRASK
ncbi:hypothetical protein FUT69_01900 [Xylella taiwanensis]|uniref:Alanine acetyltransferase n=2 Tax=Xylella taiwanensis TaxID=1444770 RepID=Z9JKN1_9GAMM|nr:hypothetical protein AB672_09310 [Xylella taiwanensis]EWS78965.1 hypothetical protein AF72_02070 [Xylella taiwanensis]NBI35995.1 hypothetical protein [Xylella taiwanensis]QKD99012.1 hypothetical protein PLS229_09345 [Xylella taiwanensis]